MRLLSIGRPLPDRRIDNHTIFNAPAAFDYEAIAIDPEGAFASVRELLDASAEHRTHADVPVVNALAGPGAPAAEVLQRRRDEVTRALERGALVMTFAHPQALIAEVAGYPGLDRYFFLPAPPGLAWDAGLIRRGEGRAAAVADHGHPFARYVDAIAGDVLYRAWFEERARGFAGAARVFARSPGGAPLGAEFAVLGGSVVFLPAPASRGGDAGRAQAAALLAAAAERLGAALGDPPPWAAREAVPGLGEREAEAERAASLAREAAGRVEAAEAEAAALRRVRDVLWTEGAHALLPAAVRCLELLGFAASEGERGVTLRDPGGVRVELEAEGAEGDVGMAPHYRLRARLDARIEDEGRAPRGLVVANGRRLEPPERRGEPIAAPLRVAAEATSYALLPAPALFRAAAAALGGLGDGALAALRARIASADGLVELGDLLDGGEDAGSGDESSEADAGVDASA